MNVSTDIDEADAAPVPRAHTEFDDAVSAIRRMDAPALQQLIEQHPDLVTQTSDNPDDHPGETLLHFAVRGQKVEDRTAPDRVEIVKLLIAAGADVNVAAADGPTALHLAGMYNLPQSAAALLEAGASIEAEDGGTGGTPLTQALFHGAREAAAVIAAHGIVPANLRVAAGLGDMKLLRSFFDEDGSLKPEAGKHRVFYRTHEGWPAWIHINSEQEILDEALCYACANDRVDAAEFLLDHGAHVNAKPWFATALHWAALHGHRATAEFLVNHGADLECCDNNWHSPPWGWADVHGYSEITTYLLEVRDAREMPDNDDVWD